MIDGVHIWRAALDEAGWPGPERLPSTERERAASFLREEACRRWVAARWALRRALAEYVDEPTAAIELEEDEGGKPRLRAVRQHGVSDSWHSGVGRESEARLDIAFNLSHSNGLALVAVAEGCEVGVDVELIEPERDLVGLAERALASDEAGAVRAASESARPAVFYAAWTRHEARLKCLGIGLSAETSRRFPTSERENCRLANEDESVAVTRLDIAPGYAAAVAVTRAEVGPIDCRSLRAG